ncbi:MAG: hypothetical protein ACRC9T_04350 [Vibrionaceae bacterium]
MKQINKAVMTHFINKPSSYGCLALFKKSYDFGCLAAIKENKLDISLKDLARSLSSKGISDYLGFKRSPDLCDFYLAVGIHKSGPLV